MNDTFLMQLVGTAFGAAFGGVSAWAVIKADVALAKQHARFAHVIAKEAHERLDEHIDKHHVAR